MPPTGFELCLRLRLRWRDSLRSRHLVPSHPIKKHRSSHTRSQAALTTFSVARRKPAQLFHCRFESIPGQFRRRHFVGRWRVGGLKRHDDRGPDAFITTS